MKAIGLTRYLPISEPNSLLDVEIDKPAAKGRDLLVRIEAIADDIDAGRLRSTVSQTLTPINAENLRQAHALIEGGKAKGKITLSRS